MQTVQIRFRLHRTGPLIRVNIINTQKEITNHKPFKLEMDILSNMGGQVYW